VDTLATQWTLARELTIAELTARYRRTWAGFLWVVMNPIIMFGAQALVFKHILKVSMDNYSLFLLGGLLPWIFIRTSLEMGVPTLQFSRDLLLAFRLPPQVLILSSLLANSSNFLAPSLIMLLPVSLVTGINPWGLLVLPLALMPLLVGTAALAWWLAVLNVFYRDTRFVVTFVLNILFFLTPVFYPTEFIPENYRWLMQFNFIYLLFQPVQQCLYHFIAADFFFLLGKSLGVAAILSVASLYFWRRQKNEFYYYL